MADRFAPYAAYNYVVNLNIEGHDAEKPLGGFSDVTGLKTELHISEYRNGNDKNPYVHKYAGVHTVGPVTLKRGVVHPQEVWAWIKQARTNGVDARHDVTITLRDEAGKDVLIYKLYNVTPMGYTGPTLMGKGTGDLAIEELVLAPEDLEITNPP